jgi:hypothetical protein
VSVVDRRDEERSSSRVNCSIRSALCRRMPIGMGWRAGTAGGAAAGGGCVGSANQTNNKIGENDTGNTTGTGKGKWAVEETSRARMGPGRVEGRGSMHGNGGGIGRVRKVWTEGGFSGKRGKRWMKGMSSMNGAEFNDCNTYCSLLWPCPSTKLIPFDPTTTCWRRWEF